MAVTLRFLKGVAILIVLALCTTSTTSAGDIKFIERIEIPGEPQPLINPWDFCVTEDGLFLIPDYGAGNIKIYERNADVLKLSKIIGQKGVGSDDFSRPTYCLYDKEGNKFGALDIGLRKIFIYARIDRLEFKRVQEVPCWHGGTDILLSQDKLFVSGYATDTNENPYDFYFIDLRDDQTTFLLPSYFKYGLKSLSEYEIQYRMNSGIKAIGIKSFFDIQEDYAYFVWEGNLKITKVNIVSREIASMPFGTNPLYYIKPFASTRLLEGYRKNFKLMQSEKAKMSYVRNIFANKKFLFVISEGPASANASNFKIQFYTLDGVFLKETPMPGMTHYRMWFDKDKSVLYSLSSELSGKALKYFILTYKISE